MIKGETQFNIKGKYNLIIFTYNYTSMLLQGSSGLVGDLKKKKLY